MPHSAPFLDPSAHIAQDAVLAEGCHVEAGAVVGALASVGARTRIGANAVLVGADLELGEQGVCVQADVLIGAAAVIYPGVTLSAGVVVRPGAVVSRSVPHLAIVEGNPATIVGYVDAHAHRPPLQNPTPATSSELPVNGARIYSMSVISDLRGSLTVGEFERNIPFKPLRYFMVFDVPSRETRGEHAHRACHQFLICVKGSCAVVVDDGVRRTEVNLSSVDIGLYLPPMTWGIQYKYSADAVLMVFASHHYDPDDYIRDYDEFLQAKSGT
jgi:UDP-2-acetamido-3-amino-2,3-dideoxy-glucuronate N-acetyltransferase